MNEFVIAYIQPNMIHMRTIPASVTHFKENEITRFQVR